jgi:hypothetical protein
VLSIADLATPAGQAEIRMVLHPIGQLRRAHQTSCHREIAQAGRNDALEVAIGRNREATKEGDYPNQLSVLFALSVALCGR